MSNRIGGNEKLGMSVAAHRQRFIDSGFVDSRFIDSRFIDKRFINNTTRKNRGNGDPRGCSSMVELKPSKLMTRVRFPSPAPMVLVGTFSSTGCNNESTRTA